MPARKDNGEEIFFTRRNGKDLQVPVNPLPRIERSLFSKKELSYLFWGILVAVPVASVIALAYDHFFRMPSWP